MCDFSTKGSLTIGKGTVIKNVFADTSALFYSSQNFLSKSYTISDSSFYNFSSSGGGDIFYA